MLTYLSLSVLWILQQAVCRKIILWGDILDVPSHQFCLVQCSWFSELRMQKGATYAWILDLVYLLKDYLKSEKPIQAKSIWHFIILGIMHKWYPIFWGHFWPSPPLCVQMDFTRTFEANTKCNNDKYVMISYLGRHWYRNFCWSCLLQEFSKNSERINHICTLYCILTFLTL